MSDFIAPGWSIFIGVLTALSLLACLLLLFVASRRKVMAGDNSTGHVWDEDLREMNNPLPLWWMVLFVITVLFAAVYLVLYPGLGGYPGTLAWTSSGEQNDDNAAAQAAMQPLYARFESMTAAELAREPQAMGIGERLFLNQCAACHGSDARGSKGYPNLTDADWLGGSSLDDIKKTISEGRIGVMPALAGTVGTADDQRNLAHYVLSLSGSAHDAVAASLGRPKFATCAACHGPGGQGNVALGAPNLADQVWLHGWGEAAIMSIVAQGKTNIMPAQAARLTGPQVHVLAAYVLSLSQSTNAAGAAASR
jgi:cytochrome c oxidase cbb3-type subunit III